MNNNGLFQCIQVHGWVPQPYSKEDVPSELKNYSADHIPVTCRGEVC